MRSSRFKAQDAVSGIGVTLCPVQQLRMISLVRARHRSQSRSGLCLEPAPFSVTVSISDFFIYILGVWLLQDA